MIKIDGVKVAKEIKEQLKQETSAIIASGKRAPHLTAILVGDDGASQTYVASKEKDCHEIGFGSKVIRLPESTTEIELLSIIKQINMSEHTDGLIVQLPLPKHISEKKVTDTISPLKDVDGFTPANFGLVARGEGGFIPATPFGILKLIEAYKIDTQGKHVVVIGRSNIVGRPMSILLSQSSQTGNATVTLCHSKTKNLEFFTRHADIVVVAIGIADFLKGSMLKEGATVIDVGITRVSDSQKPKGYTLKGDADYSSLEGICYAATPVPGGVGPMTRIGLMINTLEAFKKKNNLV
ncbi:MAG: bifunctional 5,10-methylenetetrahydrofolate dehydrogenase/5,10-methenyltetrahydrofolate cyclohydrolase [Bacteroidia bacterium]|nr:bifunctional 5,10-methylenetetrahydrofolate dehydrogenase/5,10-methenyltetrahydrofolate cyclohydrolase [Bacteroidia bacterium]